MMMWISWVNDDNDGEVVRKEDGCLLVMRGAELGRGCWRVACCSWLSVTCNWGSSSNKC